MEYKAYRIIDGKPRWIVVDETGNITNRNPSKDELKGIDKFPEKTGNSSRIKEYKEGSLCPRCKETILTAGQALREKDENLELTGRWICRKCRNILYQRYDPKGSNALKSISDRRTGNLRPESEHAFGDRVQRLVCEKEGFIDLNKKNDIYSRGTPVDCFDPKTELYYQVQGRCFNSREKYWAFSGLDREIFKNYKDLICYCISKDEKIIERKYRIPFKEVIIRTKITITKDPKNNQGKSINSWYDKYRDYDIDEDNKIWNKINKEK